MGAFEAPLLSLGHNATVADAFSVVLKNGAEIRKFGLDVNNGFRIIVKTTINKKEHKEILIDPKNTTMLQRVLPVSRLMLRALAVE